MSFEGEGRSPQLGSHDSHMVQLTPSMSEGERRDPPIGGSYHLIRPNQPLDSLVVGTGNPDLACGPFLDVAVLIVAETVTQTLFLLCSLLYCDS